MFSDSGNILFGDKILGHTGKISIGIHVFGAYNQTLI